MKGGEDIGTGCPENVRQSVAILYPIIGSVQSQTGQ